MNRALIMGNGPSLDLIDFKKLKESSVSTFACNKISKLCKEKKWHPDFYAAFFAEPFRGTRYPGDIEQAKSARADIKYISGNSSTKCYLHKWYEEFVSPQDNVEFHDPLLINRHKRFDVDSFSKFKTPDTFLWHIAVTPLFQLCFQMGIKEIGLIGQDGHKIDKKNNHYSGYVGPEQAVEKIKIGNDRIIALHDAVQDYATKNNISIFNLSDDSIINHYPYMNIEEFLK